MGSEVKDITDDLPFEIPDSWVWTRLSSIFHFINGDRGKNYPAKAKLKSTGEIPFISAVNMENGTVKSEGLLYLTNEQYNLLGGGHLNRNDFVFCLRGSLGKFCQYPFPFGAIASSLVILRKYFSINDGYIKIYLAAQLLLEQINDSNNGTAQPNLGARDVSQFLFPLPPLAEQARIVTEIEKFEPLIAEYDKLEQQATKLDDEIYDKLKKSILQYAIQGKLVPQDPNDEPASVLLERIRAEKKAKLGKKYVDSYIYKGDDNCYYEKVGRNEPVRLEDLPFEIPDSWCWARLKDVTFNHGQKIPNIAFSYIDIGSIDNVNQKLSAKENIVEPEKAPSRARKIVERGDVLYATVRPYLHNMCVVEKDFSLEPIASTGFAVLAVERGIKNTFLFYYMLSPVFDQYANSSENSKGVAYPAINDEKLYKAPIPIPPQNEQQNICKLIDKCFNVLMLKDEG